jgi:hypothetical protein
MLKAIVCLLLVATGAGMIAAVVSAMSDWRHSGVL